jgi:hypothetical protein
MPLVHITSLPFAQAFDAPAAVVAIGQDLSTATGVAAKHITVTWKFFAAGHYAVDGSTVADQPRDSHPVLVDLLAPDFNSQEQIETILRALARSIAAHCDVAAENVFVNCRSARSGYVLEAGDIVRWD